MPGSQPGDLPLVNHPECINTSVGRDTPISTDSNTIREYQLMTIYHKHHIIPKHMGGNDDPANIVELTVEEHAKAHRMLFEKYGCWQDEIAWKGLSKMIDRAEAISQTIANSNKHRIQPMLGRKFSDAHKQNISRSKMGNKVWLGRRHSSHSKQLIGEKNSPRQKGKLNSQYNTMWIHNPLTKENRKIKKDQPIPNRWIKGRKISF